MIHAPILIPTLNRYNHFKRCLESLERCFGADKTDVYVALDFPPSDVYVDGWHRIDKYLQRKEQKNGFKSLVVYRRTENYFFSGKGNLNTAIRDLPEEVESYIFTEDDNEFSPCFLEYMNQNLERYKDDSSIFRICGYLPFKHKFTDEYSQFKAQRYIAWGVGCWRSKESEYFAYTIRPKMLELVNDKMVQDYYETIKCESILSSLIRMSKGGLLLDDVIVVTYMCFKGLRCILPTKSMVRNHGWDGSGQHGGFVLGYKEQEIQLGSQYVLKEAPSSFTACFEENYRLSRENSKRDHNGWLAFFSWYIYKYTGIYCEFKKIHDLGKFIKNKLNGNK